MASAVIHLAVAKVLEPYFDIKKPVPASTGFGFQFCGAETACGSGRLSSSARSTLQ